ncbi:G-PROTEIN-RECEP-F1-2 domain-containing protein [Aphelenchoides bicaudatus]|nr:G-PROTEIN-RECEP-F1-2 domain-containing protein [Aphelenchoides bicaudatus]
MPLIPNDLPDCQWTNQTEQLAVQCVQEKHGFYDVCNQECKIEVYFLYLSNQDLPLEHFVYGRLFPVLVFLVVVANLLIALVLSQKHMITPTNTVLKYMALADLFVGIIPLPWNFYYHGLKNYETEENLNISWCYMYKLMQDALPPICHNIAMWLTVLLAVQRFISIEYPLRSREVCTVKNVRIATFFIALVSVMCGLPKAFDVSYDVYDGFFYVKPGEWQRFRGCVSEFTPIVQWLNPNTFYNFYFLTRVCAFILIPSFLLTILNALLIRGIRKAQKRKEHLLKEKRARDAQRQTDSNSTSLMLVAVVSIFLIVNLPQALFMGLICISYTFNLNVGILQGTFPTLFLLIINMFMLATYPINMAIYFLMSSSFRETFKLLFCSNSCRKSWKNRLASQSQGGSGSAAFSRISARRSDPSVSVQLSGIHTEAELSTGYPTTTIVRQTSNPKINAGNNDTVFL